MPKAERPQSTENSRDVAPAPECKGEPSKSGLIETLAGLAGLLTLAATSVYAAGAWILVGELHDRQLPHDLGVVTALPREFLIGTGLLYVGLPVLIIGFATYLLFPTRDAPRLRTGGVGLFLLAGTIGLTWMALPNPTLGEILLAAVAALAALVSMGVIVLVVHQTAPIQDAGARPQMIVLLAVVVIGAVWGLCSANQRTSLPGAGVCLSDGRKLPGFLIGETSDNVYLGEVPQQVAAPGENKSTPRIASIPVSKVRRLFIGKQNADCRTQHRVRADTRANKHVSTAPKEP